MLHDEHKITLLYALQLVKKLGFFHSEIHDYLNPWERIQTLNNL